MADNKKKGLTFKELPVACKVLRIVYLVLFLSGMIPLLIGMILSIDNPGAWPITLSALGFLIPALVVIIIELNLEKKYKASPDAQVEEKKTEPSKEETPKVEPKETWICPNCGAEMTGKFCHKCGTKKPEKVVAAVASAPAKEEPVAAPVEQKKSKKGLIIGLSVGGGTLLLVGLIVGGIFGIRAIANSINGGGGDNDYLPSDYVFEVKYGTVDYETEDALTGFVFYGPEYSNKVRVYHWCYSNSYRDYRFYEIKEGSFVYTKSTQTISVSLTEYQFYGDGWTVHPYEVPEQLTFKIKTSEKMIYSSSNVNDTVVKKVTTFTNSTSTKYTGS